MEDAAALRRELIHLRTLRRHITDARMLAVLNDMIEELERRVRLLEDGSAEQA